MTNIGEQIRNARKAKGMTQDALAEAMNVSRQAVSHWETNRAMPDAETLIRLSQTLEYSFENASASHPAADKPEDRTANPEQAAAVSPAAVNQQEPKAIFPKKAVIIVTAALAIVLLVCLLLVPALTNRPVSKEQANNSNSGGDARTIEYFRQEAVNETGKSYLRIDPALKISRGENHDYWLFELTYHEMNGIALSIDRIEQIYFSKESNHIEQIITAADIQAYGLETNIPAYGDWVYSGGLPVQDSVLGVGVLLRGTDENGAALSFTAYIPFTE